MKMSFIWKLELRKLSWPAIEVSYFYYAKQDMFPFIKGHWKMKVTNARVIWMLFMVWPLV